MSSAHPFLRSDPADGRAK